MALSIWATFILYLLIVDFVIIPQSTKNVEIFPYTPVAALSNTSTGIDNDTKAGEAKKITQDSKSDSTVAQAQDVPPSSPSTNTPRVSTSKEEENKNATTKEIPFLNVFVGLPGGSVNRASAAFGVGFIATSIIVSGRFPHLVGGLPAMATTFFVSALISTKILFWISDSWTRALFISTRVFEASVLIYIGFRLKRFYTDYLAYMGPVFANFSAILLSIAFMAPESALVRSTSLLLPIWIILLAIPIFPLLKRSLSPQDAMIRKVELSLVAIAPFFVATLLNWGFHLAWLGDITMPKVSYKNAMIIYFIALIFGSITLLLKHLLPHLQTARFSWPLILVLLASITHIALFNKVFAPFFGIPIF